MPSLRQLEYLVALSETRHFRRAAEKVGVSQPTLSAQLRALEDRLGVQLVERSRGGVIFTVIGESVLGLARRILRDVQEIRDTTVSHGTEFGGTIRLGLPPTIGPYLLPRMLPQLHKAYPDFKLYVREDVPQELPGALQAGRHDVLITPLPVRGEELHSVPVFREPLFIALPADHPLAGEEAIDRSDLTGQSILTLEAGHQLHEQVEAICEEFGARLLFDFAGTSLDTLRQMVGMGMGLSFLPGLYVRSVLERDPGVKALPIRGRSLSRTVGMVWRKTSARGAEFRRLADYVRQTVERDFPDFARL